jgi:predicted permease
MRDWKKHVRERLGDLGLSAEREADVIEEIAQGLEERFADLIEQGLGERQALDEIDGAESDWSALTAAIRETKGESLIRRLERADAPTPPIRRLAGLMDGLWKDMQSARRHLSAHLWTNALAALLLAVGVGAAAVAFIAVRAVVFPQLPFEDAERVIVLHHRGIASGREMNFPGVIGPADFYRMRELPQIFKRVEGWSRTQAILSSPVRSEAALIEYVTDGMFDFLGANAQLGRTFIAEEFEPGANDVMVISAGLAERYFENETPIGRSIDIDGHPHEIVGVMPPGFQIPNRLLGQAWLPIRHTADEQAGRQGLPIAPLAQLRPGLSLQQAELELETFSDELNAEFGTGPFQELQLVSTPVLELLTGDARSTLWLLSGAVALVLLVAVINVAAILLAQLTARRREINVRAALGAARARLLRQVFVEALMLYVPAGVGALALAWGLLRWLQSAVPALLPGAPLATAAIPGLQEAQMDPATLAFLAVVGVCIAGLVCIPLAGAVAMASSGDLASSSRETKTVGAGASFRALSFAQIALTTAVLIVACLLVKGMNDLYAADPGYNRDGLVAVSVKLARHRFGPGEAPAPFPRLLEFAQNLPGVTSAAFSLGLPTGSPPQAFVPYEEGQASEPGDIPPVGLETVSETYFETLGIPLLEGRLFETSDSLNSPPVLIVNQAFADQLWPGESAVGKRLRFHEGAEIVGVVGTAKTFTGEMFADMTPSDSVLLQSLPVAYQFIRQNSFAPFGSLLLRTEAEPESVASVLVDEIRTSVPEQPEPTVQTLEQVYASQSWRPRLATWLMTALALVACLLSAGGIYGSVAFEVSRRRSEIGLRMALGATGSRVVGAFASRAVGLALAGMTIGIALAIAGSRFAASHLYGFTATDPATYAAAAAALLAISAAAALVAAAKAAAVDPMTALRRE